MHTDPERVIKDIAGQYVVLSDDYVYLGADAVSVDSITKYYPNFQETKVYKNNLAKKIVDECLKYSDR